MQYYQEPFNNFLKILSEINQIKEDFYAKFKSLQELQEKQEQWFRDAYHFQELLATDQVKMGAAERAKLNKKIGEISLSRREVKNMLEQYEALHQAFEENTIWETAEKAKQPLKEIKLKHMDITQKKINGAHKIINELNLTCTINQEIAVPSHANTLVRKKETVVGHKLGALIKKHKDKKRSYPGSKQRF